MKILMKQDQLLQKITAAALFEVYFNKHARDGMVPFNIH